MNEIDDEVIFALAAQRGEAAVAKVSEEVEANGPEQQTLHRLERLVRHGYETIDIIVRKDGVETRFEGDWIARLFRQKRIQ